MLGFLVIGHNSRFPQTSKRDMKYTFDLRNILLIFSIFLLNFRFEDWRFGFEGLGDLGKMAAEFDDDGEQTLSINEYLESIEEEELVKAFFPSLSV